MKHWCWLIFGLRPRFPQVVWCHWGEIKPFSATLAQGGLAECDQPGINPLKYSATNGHCTRATGRTDSEIHWFPHRAIMIRATGRTDSKIHSFSHWTIATRATGRTDCEVHSFSHWAIMTRATGRTDSEVHSPTELSWPVPRGGQIVRYILPLSYHDPCHGEDR